MKQLTIINGPNLNLLGKREPEIYGSSSFSEYYQELTRMFKGRIRFDYFQSNHEGEIIDKLHEVGFDVDGIILNGGALTHYSHAIADAIAAIETPVIEVHISNIYSREAYRATSLTASKCIGAIAGLGLDGYRLAVEYFMIKD